jgi:class 3 adenylate cyclase
MATLQTTVIMKTDIQASTAKFRALSDVDQDALLTEHRQFVSRLAAAREGRVVKPEGDGFWLVFPSATAAALAAMSMQEELRLSQPGKGEDRLAMRIILTVGDVLHQDGGLFGDAVVLATRIESITPPDEIYASVAAWLLMHRAEVRTSLVDTFTFKGFPESVAVYRVEQTHRMHIIDHKYILVADLKFFGMVAEAFHVTVFERVLDNFLGLVGRVCAEFAGTNRISRGDSYVLTFPNVIQAIAAADRLLEEWGVVQRLENIRCPMNIVVSRGELYAFRSFLLGPDLSLAMDLETATSQLASGDTSIFITGQVREGLAGSTWEERLQPIDIRPLYPRLADIAFYRLGNL